MEELLSLIGNKCVEVYQTFEFTLFGITFNFWQIALWFLIAGFIVWIIKNIVDL